MNWGMFAAGLALGILLGFVPSYASESSAVFSPEDGAQIPALIDSARDSIEIEVYILSSRDIVEALERAKSRGVDVRIIVERNVIGGENDAIFDELDAKGFRIRYASRAFQLTHSKFMIIDGKKVLVGSHNFSNSALYKNREASVIVADAPTVREFGEIFDRDWDISSSA